MNSSALFRLQSDYGSDSDLDEEESKPEVCVNTNSSICLIDEIKEEPKSDDTSKTDIHIDLKPNIELKAEPNIISDPNIVSDPITDAESKTIGDTKPNVEPKPMPYFDPNVNLNAIGTNGSYQEMVDNSCHEIDISSDSSSSSWSLSSDESHEEIDNRKATKTFVKTKGELCLEDLPPIENLTISVGVEELSQLGRVASIVDQLVIVQSFRSMPALDLDSVLFFKDGQPLGRIFDVFGPVIEPRYAVRFNDIQQIIDLKISVDTPVYFAAEQKQPITGFVFAEQLRRMKGSDASWKHNNEPPEEVIEYSDDEMERLHKKKQNSKRTYSQRNSKLKQNQNIFSIIPKQS